MPKDYANITKLSNAERLYELEHLWENSYPGAEETAQNLMRSICCQETPFVLSVEAPYGMGKTYFFSRFSEYLNKNGVSCIYISAWENDYAPSPFIYLIKEILHFLKSNLTATTESSLDCFISRTKNVAKKLLFSISINTKYVNFNIEDAINAFIDAPDEINKFKSELSEKLVNLVKSKRPPLVIIVDELDRCRPDYALKTIEIIKHFFDIENLFFILPINKEAIGQAVTSVFGQIKNSEHYLKKLIDRELIIPIPKECDYKKIAQCYITTDKLKTSIFQNHIEKNDNYNGFDIIAKSIGKYACYYRLTYRDTVKVCLNFLSYAQNIEQKIRIEYLIFLLCAKASSIQIPYSECPLPLEHPFYIGIQISSTIFNKKQSLTIQRLAETTRRYKYSSSWGINYSDLVRDQDSFKTYNEFYSYIDKVKKRLHENSDDTPPNMAPLENLVIEAEKQTKEYQRKYGACDEDKELKEFYDNLVDNPLSMYKND